MHRSSTLPQRHQKPLSTSALGIPHASFLSLPQRHQNPLSASALGIPHASFFSAPAASSKALSASARRIQYALFAPVASHQNNHFLQVNTESRMHRSSTLPQCHVKSHFP